MDITLEIYYHAKDPQSTYLENNRAKKPDIMLEIALMAKVSLIGR